MKYYIVFWRPEGAASPHSLFCMNEDDANWLEALLKEQPDVAGALRMEVDQEPKHSAWQSLWNSQKRDGPVQ